MADFTFETTTASTAYQVRLDIFDFPKDPAGASATFKMITDETIDGGSPTTKINNSTATITEVTDHLDGTWDIRLTYTFTAANLDTADDYLGQWKVTFSDAGIQYFPFTSTQKMKIKVNAAL
jgi:hypothetical protein